MEIELLSETDRVVRVRFRGVVYRRYPRAKQSSDRNYFRPGPGDVLAGRSYLHRDLWVAHRGPIPNGYEIDHRDGNPLNNALDNLQLLTADDHRRRHLADHSARTRARLARRPDHLAAMLAGAAAWHGSDAGREWHRGHARRVAAAQPSVALVCEVCKREFRVKRYAAGRTRFCGNNCKATARRRSGADNEQRTCPCGAMFSCNRYLPTRHCSRSCARRHAAAGPVAGVQPDG